MESDGCLAPFDFVRCRSARYSAQMNRSLFEALNGFDGGPAIDALAQLAARSTLGFVAGIVALAAMLLWRRDRKTVFLALAVALAVGLTDLLIGQMLKPLFAELRPCHQWPETVKLHGTICGGQFGFPSNHAANNAAIVAVLVGQVPAALFAFVAAIAAFVGWSRIYVGAHFPGDVLGGYLFGALVGWGVRLLVLHFSSRLQRS